MKPEDGLFALGDDSDDLLLASPRPWRIGQKRADAASIPTADTSAGQPNLAILCRKAD